MSPPLRAATGEHRQQPGTKRRPKQNEPREPLLPAEPPGPALNIGVPQEGRSLLITQLILPNGFVYLSLGELHLC